MMPTILKKKFDLFRTTNLIAITTRSRKKIDYFCSQISISKNTYRELKMNTYSPSAIVMNNNYYRGIILNYFKTPKDSHKIKFKKVADCIKQDMLIDEEYAEDEVAIFNYNGYSGYVRDTIRENDEMTKKTRRRYWPRIGTHLQEEITDEWYDNRNNSRPAKNWRNHWE